jgi:hypothetical protein
LHTLSRHFHNAQLPIQFAGQPELLEAFNDVDHGYLRVSVAKGQVQADYIAVPDPSPKGRDTLLKPSDTVKV